MHADARISSTISRRQLLRFGGAALATSCLSGKIASTSLAQEDPASKLAELVRAGDFGGAATIMRGKVEQRPLDRTQRLVLGQLHFGNLDFAAAAGEFEIIEKRGGIKDDFGVIDLSDLLVIGSDDKAALAMGSRFKDSATWLYLTMLRQGASDASLPEGPQESIRALLRQDTTLDEYVELQSQMLNAVLSEVESKYGDHPEISDMVETAQSNVRAELVCVGNFAVAEQALGRADAKAAKGAFQDALETEADRIAEFHIAKAELARLS